MAYVSASSPLPTLQFESSPTLQSMCHSSISFLFVIYCLSHRYLLVSSNRDFVFPHLCCCWVVWEIMFKRRRSQTCLLCCLESRSAQDHFRNFFYLPGGKGRRFDSLVKIMKFKARRRILPAIQKSGWEENWKNSNPIKDFSKMQKMDKWSIWIMEFPVW